MDPSARNGHRPPLDVTRLLTTAELVTGAVLIARILARRPSAPKARITMGPGGWVSMKGGALGIRPARRFGGRSPAPRRRPSRTATTRRPLWARVLSAVPLEERGNRDRDPE